MHERATAMPAAMAGGGEMGELIRAHDWASTALGPVDSWPQSLLSALSILLSAQSPTYIGWGESLVQLYNDAYRPILGSTKHPTSLGQTCQACFPEIWGVVGPMLSRVMATGEPTWREDELLCLERHGYLEESYFTFSYSAVRAEDGRVGGVWVSCLETSQRVFHERRLAVLRRLAGEVGGPTVGDVCSRAVALLDGARRDLPFTLLYLIDTESGAARRVAASPDAPTGAEWVDLAGDDAWAIAQVARTGVSALVAFDGAGGAGPWPEPVRRMAIQPVLVPGEAAPTAVLVVGLSPRLPVDDAYRGFLELVASQIGVAMAAARALQLERQRAEALAELDRAKTTFFNNVSHELRTPLTLLLGPLEQLLTRSAVDGEVRDAIDLAHRNGLRLLRLVNSLLDFARVGAQRAEPHFEPTALDAFTAELASCFESAIGEAGLRLVVDCPPAADAVYVDRAMWEKIVLNLLANAFKFTFEGEIRVALRAVGAHAELRVDDTGIGIPADEQERIFARFHRVRGARSRSHEGTGIGLALVRDLVELHHGSIDVSSAEGQGSRFVVRVPLGRGHLPPGQVHETEQQVARPVAPRAFTEEARRWLEPIEPATAASGDRGHILVVDDNADMRQYLRTLLERRGWPVEVAGDGASALAALRARPPALLLTDAMMPLMDGFELLARVRADPVLRALPVVMITARAGLEAAVEGIEAGADDYVVKPFRSDELVRRVDATVRLARSREEASSYRGLVDHMVHGIGRCAGTVVIAANPALATLLGYQSAAAVIGVDLRARAFVDAGDVDRFLGADMAGRSEDVQLRRRDGTLFWGRISRGSRRDDVCELMIEDVSERRILEEQVRQAQKMDAIGQLTAGIAHDFNNLLTAILVNTDLSVRALQRGRTAVLDELDTVRAAGWRGADMVRKLMAFSRRRESDLAPVDLGAVVAGVAGMLQRLLPENIEIRTRVEPAGMVVQADAGAVEQVLLNLATNARDAMPDGGVLRIDSHPLVLDAARCATLGWGEPGEHVLVTVRDDGAGMDETARQRVFEPFFTTKAPGRGTGLGMAMVYAIMQQHRGTVSIDSAPGQGTEIRLLFPRHAVAEEAAALSRREVPRRGAGETVLVVEDDLIVRDAARAALEGAGYRVLLARDGVEAIRLLDGGGTRIDLVISDEVMPRCTGAELYAAARRMLHMPRFLFTSGYSDVASRPYPGGVPFLAKPWSDAELTGRVREVLDAGVGSFGLPSPRSSPTLQ